MASIYDLIRETTTALGETGSTQKDILKQQQGLANANVASAEAIMPSILAISGQKTAGDLEAQDRGIAVRQELGNDINDPNSLLSILVQDFRENTLAAREQQIAIAEKKQVSLWDDLPQFLINQVTLPDEINAYNATLGRAKAAQDGIASMQALTTASAQAAKATTQSMTKQTAIAQGEVDKVMLDQKLNTLKIDALGYDSEALKITQHNNATQLQWAMQEHSMKLQDAAAARADEMHKKQMAAVKASDLTDQQILGFINAGAAAHQLPKFTLDDYKMLKGTNKQKMLMKLFDQGYAAASLGTDTVGETPADAIINVMEVGGLRGPENKPSRDYLKDVYTRVIRTYDPSTKMTPQVMEEVKGKINDVLYGKANPKTGNRDPKSGELYEMAIDAERPGSIYKAPELPVILNSSKLFKDIPSIQSNVLYSTVLKPAADAGFTKADPLSVYAQAKEALNRGLITDKQMYVGLADFYKTVTAVTYASSGAGKFGLPYRAGYMTKVEDPTGFGSIYVDATRPDTWVMYDQLSKAAKAYSEVPNADLIRGMR